MLTEKAFKTGSEFPELQQGVLRLYSMRLCPYAHRTRIVLAHKNIKHEVVNINLKEKPQWYLEKVNPLGQVPAIQKDNVIVCDSVIVNEYLDAVFPANRLTPTDPYERAKDRMFLERWSQVVKPFYKLFLTACEDKDAIKELLDALEVAEQELNARGQLFFGGKTMGMLDVVLWPHAERIDLLQYTSSEVRLDSDRFPKIVSWIEAMKTVPAIKETATVQEVFTTFVSMVKEKNVDYDIGLR